MVPFRYELPWTGRVIRIENGDASAALPSRDVYAMPTESRAPISIALHLLSLSRGQSFKANRGNEVIRFIRDK